jgi:hypothetical protein
MLDSGGIWPLVFEKLKTFPGWLKNSNLVGSSEWLLIVNIRLMVFPKRISPKLSEWLDSDTSKGVDWALHWNLMTLPPI